MPDRHDDDEDPELFDDSTSIDAAPISPSASTALQSDAPPSSSQAIESSGPTKRLPQKLGRYTLTKRLGIGGMAEVFLAEQQGAAGFKKLCVVKKMLPHLAEQQRFVDMFLREAKLAATLHHPNIVQIWDLGEVDGSFFIAMEYVDGMPLNLLARTAWRAGKSVPMEVVCCAIADAAAGLGEAHAHKNEHGLLAPIVHRDVSPDNLMIDKNGDTKIVDFGIARQSDANRTRTGELKGKVPFMAPEQLRGEELDGRTDLYALGVTAYWLLTGKRPFHGPTDLVVMNAILSNPVRPPRDLNARIPEGLNALVMNLLEKERDRRLSTAGEVREALEHVLSSKRTIVAPFVREIVELPTKASGDDPPSAASGFIPATPHTDSINDGWRNLFVERAATERNEIVRQQLVTTETVSVASSPSPAQLAPAPLASSPTFDVPPASIADTIEPEMMPSRSKLPIAAAVVAVCAIGAGIFVVAMKHSSANVDALPSNVVVASPAPIVPPTPPASSVPAPPTPTPTPTATPTPATTTTTNEAATTKHEAHTVAVAQPKAPTKRDVIVKAPSFIEWRVDGKSAGSGSTTLHVSPSTKSIVAIDKHRGGQTSIPVADSIDYASLPHGKLQARAKPLADVFLGPESLGTTPFEDVDVVAGSYSVRFVYKGAEVTKNVVVTPGATARAIVDFTNPK